MNLQSNYCIARENCENCGQQVAWVGIVVNFVLVVLKVFVGITSGSKALLADGLHSASNIITAFVILISRRLTKRRATPEFQYGYGKAEFLAAAFVTLFIVISAIGLIMVSIKHLLHAPSHAPHATAVIVAIISIGANELLFRFMRCAGTSLKSQTILANAWGNRADCLSSFAVILGVVGSQFGIPHLDPIAALIVVAVIIKISVTILIDSVRFLMDVSVNDHYAEEIKDVVRDIEGVQKIADLRTRQFGHYIWAELDILVDPLHSLKNGHFIGQKVQNELVSKIHDLEFATVYVKPNGE